MKKLIIAALFLIVGTLAKGQGLLTASSIQLSADSVEIRKSLLKFDIVKVEKIAEIKGDTLIVYSDFARVCSELLKHSNHPAFKFIKQIPTINFSGTTGSFINPNYHYAY